MNTNDFKPQKNIFSGVLNLSLLRIKYNKKNEKLSK